MSSPRFLTVFQLVPRLVERNRSESHQETRMSRSTKNYESSTESSDQDKALRRDLRADETCGVVSKRLSELVIDQDEGSLKKTRVPGSTGDYQSSRESDCRDEASRKDLMDASVVNSEVNEDGQASFEITSVPGSTEYELEGTAESKSLCEVLRRDLMACTLNDNSLNSKLFLSVKRSPQCLSMIPSG